MHTICREVWAAQHGSWDKSTEYRQFLLIKTDLQIYFNSTHALAIQYTGHLGINFKDKFALLSHCHQRQLFFMSISIPLLLGFWEGGGTYVCVPIANLDPYPLVIIILPTEELQQLHCWGPTFLLAFHSPLHTDPPSLWLCWSSKEVNQANNKISSGECDSPSLHPLHLYMRHSPKKAIDILSHGDRATAAVAGEIRRMEVGAGEKIKIQFVVSLGMIHWNSEHEGRKSWVWFIPYQVESREISFSLSGPANEGAKWD